MKMIKQEIKKCRSFWEFCLESSYVQLCKIDIILFILCFCVYWINFYLKSKLDCLFLQWYLNDIIVGIAFPAYTNILFSFKKRRISSFDDKSFQVRTLNNNHFCSVSRLVNTHSFLVNEYLMI